MDRALEIVLKARDEATKEIQKVAKEADEFGKLLAGSFKNAAIVSGVALAGVVGESYRAVKAFEESQAAVTQLEAVLKSTNGVAGVTKQAALDLASSLERVTTYSDESVIGVENLLLTFTKIGKNIFPEATKVVLDMSTALGQDLKSSSIQLGKALQDPILGVTALRRVGVNFSESQQEVIKSLVESGRQLDAQKMILKELQTEFGGSAEAAGNTFAGSLAKLKNQVNNIEEALGGVIIKGLQPFIEKAIDAADEINKVIKGEATLKDLTKTLTKDFGVFGNVLGNTIELLAKNKDALIALAGAFAGVLAISIIAASIAIAQFIGLSLPVLAIFAGIGALVALVIAHFGGLKNIMENVGKAFDFVHGKVQPLIDKFEYIKERLGQILNGMGISGEFGGIRNFFSKAADDALFWTQRIIQIVGDFYQKVKNFLAFGGTEGNASFVQALEGIWNRIKPILDGMQPLFDQIKANLALTGQIIQTQVAPAWDALVQVMKPFIEAIMPPLLKFLGELAIGLGIIIGFIIALAAAILTGLISAFANALPYVMQALEGLIQFIRGFIQLLTGLFTGDLGMVIEGVKQMFAGGAEFIKNALDSVSKFVSGFIKGVIAFFTSLYNALIGHSIIPDIVNGIISFFTRLRDTVTNIITNLVNNITGLFGGLVSKAFDWGRGIISGIINGIKAAVNAAGKLAGKLLGELGISKEELMSFDSGGYVPRTGLAMVHAGEYVLSRDMLAGRQPIMAPITNNNTPININAVISDSGDIDTLSQKLAFYLKTSGAL